MSLGGGRRVRQLWRRIKIRTGGGALFTGNVQKTEHRERHVIYLGHEKTNDVQGGLKEKSKDKGRSRNLRR